MGLRLSRATSYALWQLHSFHQIKWTDQLEHLPTIAHSAAKKFRAFVVNENCKKAPKEIQAVIIRFAEDVIGNQITFQFTKRSLIAAQNMDSVSPRTDQEEQTYIQIPADIRDTLKAQKIKTFTIYLNLAGVKPENISAELEAAIVCGIRQIARTGVEALPSQPQIPTTLEQAKQSLAKRKQTGTMPHEVIIELDASSITGKTYAHLSLYRNGGKSTEAVASLTVFPKAA